MTVENVPRRRQRLRALMRRLVRLIPRPVWAAIYPAIAGVVAPKERYPGDEYEDRASAFAWIYEDNRWHNGESKSGVGSTRAYTHLLRDDLEQLLAQMHVRRLLDAPCGDFNWMQYVRMPADCVYLGRDIVPKLIDDLKQTFPEKDWEVLDIVSGSIPDADVWLCRDVLFHLPLDDCQLILRNMAASNVAYFLTKTYDFVKLNEDVRPGGFRYINLRAAPFNLPAPIRRVADFHVPGPPGFLDLWTREQIQAALRWRDSG